LPLDEQLKLLNGPALKAPPGTTSNLVNPPNLNGVACSVMLSSAIICTLLVSLRLYSRIFYHKKFHLEDLAAVAALGTFAGFLYSSWMTLLHPGLFVHQWNVSLRTMFHAAYYMTVGVTFYGNVIMCLKIGILLEWSKTFVPRGHRNTFWWTCHVFLGINVVFYTICTFVETFGCRPRAKLWDFTLSGTCLDMPKVNIASAVVNFLSDLVILVLPQRIIWSLHMSTSKKAAVAALFALGVFASICAAFRIHSAVRFATNPDVLYNASDMGSWCTAEITAGFLVLCLPPMRKMFVESPFIRKLK
ncbi:hypothetical protein CC86DRAFT_237099, partial [Ophiobolus disseminans]